MWFSSVFLYTPNFLEKFTLDSSYNKTVVKCGRKAKKPCRETHSKFQRFCVDFPLPEFTNSPPCLLRATDLRLQGAVLRRQLQSMADLLPPSLQEGFMESCESLVEDPDPLIAAQEIQTVFRDFLPPGLLPDGLLESCVTCLQQFVQSRVHGGAGQLVQSGVFWVHMGLVQIKVWTPQTIFDPAVKRAYKLNYAQQEVRGWRSFFLYLNQVFISILMYLHIYVCTCVCCS